MPQRNILSRLAVWLPFIALLLAPSLALAQQSGNTFDAAAQSAERQLQEAIEELAALRRQIEAETVPMSRQLSEAEANLAKARQDLQKLVRELDSRSLEVNNLSREIKGRQDETAYVSNLLDQFIRSFESRLHIAELQRYEEPIEAARLAPENDNLTPQQIFDAQASVLTIALDRLFDAVAGSRFEGSAVDSSGTVQVGTFVLIGPSAIFHSRDGSVTGTAEQRLGSQEPSIVPFADPDLTSAAAVVAKEGRGTLPFDPTLGNAHKVEELQEGLIEHIIKGGAVMVPIFILAGLALLIVLYKAVGFLFVGRPSPRRMRAVLDAVARNDRPAAVKAAKATGRPTNRMLLSGVEHMDEPRELVEEVMYENVLSARLKLQRFLPFLATSAAAAPLLGLLGTVMGIMDTFTSITIFGSGDVKNLSGGISKALITTEYGLIVAIPALLLHAFLARRAKAIVDSMEISGAAFLNELSRAKWRGGGTGAAPSLAADGSPTSAREHFAEAVTAAADGRPAHSPPAPGRGERPHDGTGSHSAGAHRPPAPAPHGKPPVELAPSAT